MQFYANVSGSIFQDFFQIPGPWQTMLVSALEPGMDSPSLLGHLLVYDVKNGLNGPQREPIKPLYKTSTHSDSAMSLQQPELLSSPSFEF